MIIICQSEIPDNYFIVETVESDRQTDGLQPQKKRKSYNDMLRAISSPLADTGITSEDKLAAYDENAWRTAECVLPLEIKLHKGMFRQALRYLIAYSYRMPEDESIRNFTDMVIDDLVNMAHYGRYAAEDFETNFKGKLIALRAKYMVEAMEDVADG